MNKAQRYEAMLAEVKDGNWDGDWTLIAAQLASKYDLTYEEVRQEIMGTFNKAYAKGEQEAAAASRQGW